MAYPQARSCNSELHAGMTDGAFKKAAPHRGGIVEETTFAIRREMAGVWHGFHDRPDKILPDGRPARVPYHYDVTPEDVENV